MFATSLRRTLSLFLQSLVFLLTLAQTNSSFAETPTEFATKLYSLHRTGYLVGIPDEEVAKFFSPELQRLFAFARKDVADTPRDIKPFLADYPVLVANISDPYSKFRVIKTSGKGKEATSVIVEFTYQLSDGSADADFAILYLEPESKSWSITDIVLICGRKGEHPKSVLADLRRLADRK